MTGSEKQIAWAERIIAEARNTIAANIENYDALLVQHPDFHDYIMGAKIWRKVRDELEAALAKIADKPAGYYIDNRTRMDGDAMHNRATALKFWYDKHPETIERDLANY